MPMPIAAGPVLDYPLKLNGSLLHEAGLKTNATPGETSYAIKAAIIAISGKASFQTSTPHKMGSWALHRLMPTGPMGMVFTTSAAMFGNGVKIGFHQAIISSLGHTIQSIVFPPAFAPCAADHFCATIPIAIAIGLPREVRTRRIVQPIIAGSESSGKPQTRNVDQRVKLIGFVPALQVSSPDPILPFSATHRFYSSH